MAKFKITGLPKAQLGKGTTLEVSPFSLNANQSQLASSVYGEYDPEFLIGARTPLGGSRDPRFSSDLGLTLGIPYSGPMIPSVNADWRWRYRPSAVSAGAFAPTVQTDITLGWDPTQGLNHKMVASPRWEFANRSPGAYRQPRWPAGAWKGYAGPAGGWEYRQHSFVPGLEGYENVGETRTGNFNFDYGAVAGIEGRPFKSTPLRVGADASLMFQPGKGQAEEQFNADTDFNTVKWGMTPMLKVKAVYPIGANLPKKKEAEEEKLKIDAARAKDKNFMIDTPVITGPGVDWDYENKPESSGIPVGNLPGYEPETGRQLTEEESMQRYSQGPTLEYGGTSDSMYMDLDDNEIEQYKQGGYVVEELPQAQKGGEQIYTYADRPEATYKKDAKGNWLISLPSTDWKYVPVKDSSGKRAGELNEKAKPVEKPTLMTKAYSSVKDFNRLPEADKKATASMYAYNESMRQKGYVQDPLTGDFVNSKTPSALNNFNDGALESTDWLWTLPMAAPAVSQFATGLGAQSLPFMSRIPGATYSNALNSMFIGNSLYSLPGNVMDWYNVIQGEKDWEEAAMDSADIALGFIGSGAGWKSLLKDVKTLKAPSKIVSKTNRALSNVIKPGTLSTGQASIDDALKSSVTGNTASTTTAATVKPTTRPDLVDFFRENTALEDAITTEANDYYRLAISPQNIERAAALDAAEGTKYVDALNGLAKHANSKNTWDRLPFNIKIEPNPGDGTGGYSAFTEVGKQKIKQGIQTGPEDRLIVIYEDAPIEDVRRRIQHELKHHYTFGQDRNFYTGTSGQYLSSNIDDLGELSKTNPQLAHDLNQPAFEGQSISQYDYLKKPAEIDAYIQTNLRDDLVKKGILKNHWDVLDNEKMARYFMSNKMRPEIRQYLDMVGPNFLKMFNRGVFGLTGVGTAGYLMNQGNTEQPTEGLKKGGSKKNTGKLQKFIR